MGTYLMRGIEALDDWLSAVGEGLSAVLWRLFP